MLETLALAAAVASGPDHITLLDRSVNMKKPATGAFGEQIGSAARVPKKWRPFARCVLDRESGANLENLNSGEGAKNPRSSASGRFQFLNSQWQHGGSFMVKDRLVTFGVPKSHASKVRKKLGRTPIHKWDGHFQQALFNEVVRRGGWFHWRNGDRCDGQRP
jgi:hypothetical protein